MTFPRVPEPETVMESSDSVDGFHSAGLPGGPLFPIYQFNALRLSRLVPRHARLLDLACGPAHFLSHFLCGRPDVRAVGIDLSRPMLDRARVHLGQCGMSQRVDLLLDDAANAHRVVTERVDAVVCMSALHQCPGEADLARILDAVRALRERDGCAVWLFDVVRPDDEKMVEVIPRSFEMFSNERLSDAFKIDWMNSLRAGWTFCELSQRVRAAGLNLRGIQANHSQLHFAQRALGCADDRPVGWQGPELSLRDGRRLRTIEAAFDAAS